MLGRVVVVTNRIPEYRISTLNALSKLCREFQIVLSEQCSDGDDNYKNLNIYTLKTFHLHHRRKHPSGFTYKEHIHLSLDLLHYLNKVRPDVIISSELGFRTMQASIYKLLNPFTRFVIHADYSERTELKRGLLRTIIRRLVIRMSDKVIVNGDSGADYVVKSLKYNASTISRIPYATDISTFTYYGDDSVKNNTLRLLYVGQSISLKGIIPFVSCLSEYMKSINHFTLEFKCVGQGPLDDEIQVFDTPRNLKINKMPYVPYKELPAVYSWADCFVFPTLADTWGLVINEAMACGVPVLGSVHSQAAMELIEDGVNGWLFDPEDRVNTIQNLNKLCSSPRGVLREMGNKARLKALELSPDSIASRLAQCCL